MAVNKTLMEQIASPNKWEGLSAQKLREATRKLEQVKDILEETALSMGATEVPAPTLLSEITTELERRGIGNAEMGKEVHPPMSRMAIWNYRNGHTKIGPKVRARFEVWLEDSLQKPAKE